MHITIDVDDAGTQRYLTGMLRRGADLRDPLDDSNTIVGAGFTANVVTQGAAAGRLWPPRETAYPWPPLVRTGRLLASLAHPYHRVGPFWAEYGTRVSYAGYHQEGYSKRGHRGRVPARPPVNLPYPVYGQIGDKIANHIIGSEGAMGVIRTLSTMRGLFR